MGEAVAGESGDMGGSLNLSGGEKV